MVLVGTETKSTLVVYKEQASMVCNTQKTVFLAGMVSLGWNTNNHQFGVVRRLMKVAKYLGKACIFVVYKEQALTVYSNYQTMVFLPQTAVPEWSTRTQFELLSIQLVVES